MLLLSLLMLIAVVAIAIAVVVAAVAFVAVAVPNLIADDFAVAKSCSFFRRRQSMKKSQAMSSVDWKRRSARKTLLLETEHR